MHRFEYVLDWIARDDELELRFDASEYGSEVVTLSKLPGNRVRIAPDTDRPVRDMSADEWIHSLPVVDVTTDMVLSGLTTECALFTSDIVSLCLPRQQIYVVQPEKDTEEVAAVATVSRTKWHGHEDRGGRRPGKRAWMEA